MGKEKGDWKNVTAEIKDKGRERERDRRNQRGSVPAQMKLRSRYGVGRGERCRMGGGRKRKAGKRRSF